MLFFLILTLFIFFRYIRYTDRRLILYILSYFSGIKKVVFIHDDLELIHKVLRSSNEKGFGIEYWFATPSWEPIYNIESIDGEIWKETRKYFHTIASKINLQKLEDITNEYCKQVNIIDSETISRTIARIHWKILFNTEINEKDLDLLYRGSIEWRKQVAMKGEGNLKIKQECYSLIEKHTLEDKKLVSAVLQPFFISPMINYSDIFVTIEKYKKYYDEKRIEKYILECIRIQHPFPILERRITEPFIYNEQHFTSDTQVYIELDKLSKIFEMDNDTKLSFGVGYRSCMGKHFAMKSLIPMTREWIYNEKFCPQNGHMYSGRNNDGIIDIWEILYLMKTLLTLFFRIILN